MTSTDLNNSGIGGPGIWDQMPLVPPTKAPQEVDDSKLIWSKPKPAVTTRKNAKSKPTLSKARTAKKATKKKAATKKKTKKIAGRSKRR